MNVRFESIATETTIATAIEVHVNHQIIVAIIKASAVAVIALAGIA
ncbi:hypothetical protein [Brachybacterium nesterenkovii]